MIWWRLITSFFRIGLFTIGGGYALLPLIQKEVVKNGWLTPHEYANVLAISEVTPGPMSVNAATFVGYRIAGIPGAVVATFSLVLPSFLMIMLLGRFLRRWLEEPHVNRFFSGVRPAVTGTIAGAAVLLTGTMLFPGGITSLGNLDIKFLFISLISIGLLEIKFHPILTLSIAGLAGWILY